MGVEETKQFTKIFFDGLPDLTHPVVELIADGDKVGRYEGTHTAEFRGLAPTGNKEPFSVTSRDGL
jgi:predicted ester cyclase